MSGVRRDVGKDRGVGDDDDRRRRLGAWYTPPALVAHVVANTVPDRPVGRVVVLDPACGDGRFLVEASRVLRERGAEPVLVGFDIDADALAVARQHPDLREADLECADALDPRTQWAREPVDLIVGNPPFLSPLSARVRDDDRHRGVPSPAGAYADVAVRFLDRSVRTVRADGGRIGLVLPISVLASRDAAAVRERITSTCEMPWFWWSPTPVFDAAVTTCAIGLERATPPRAARAVVRAAGIPPRQSLPTPQPDGRGWGDLIADSLGVPETGALSTSGTLGDRARVVADFRDQYYGLLDALVEVDRSVAPPAGVVPLVTTAHIDPGSCHWGDRPVRYGKRRWSAPAVDLHALGDAMRSWAATRTVPKVLVATQTRVIEAVADPTGRWLPAVPVISVTPRGDGADDGATGIDEIAAVLTSPVPSALIARRSAGTGLTPGTVRIRARHLAELPWPSGSLAAAVEALRSGDVDQCAELVSIAYGIPADARHRLQSWWLSMARRRR